MNVNLENIIARRCQRSYHWCVTGAAGFIGSHLVASLLENGQHVVALDNFSTGKQANLDAVRMQVGADAWSRFHLLQGDVRDPAVCRLAVKGVDHVLHQAALGSVPLSLEKPLDCHAANVTGCANMLEAARQEGVATFVYASSSAVYGDDPGLPKSETTTGALRSPYALSKSINEQYADLYARCYGLRTIGLRYFNVYGPRQDPNGAYAAVIPRWFHALAHGQAPRINGDGLTTRDFCHVSDVLRANILAATSEDPTFSGQVFNIASGTAVTLLELFALIREITAVSNPLAARIAPEYGESRPGDIRHSLADIRKSMDMLGFSPDVTLREGLAATAAWYLNSDRQP